MAPCIVSLSQHTFRSQRRLAAKMRQDAIISELEWELAAAKYELSEWWNWWQSSRYAESSPCASVAGPVPGGSSDGQVDAAFNDVVSRPVEPRLEQSEVS